MKNENVIQVENLSKMFGDFTAVDNITFQVGKGEVFGFLGANGAGKTTAMKMLIGISTPTSGEAKVAGFDVRSHAENVKKSIGYMSQRFSLYNDLTIRENITFFGGIYGLKKSDIKAKSQNLIDELDLHDEADKLVGSLPLGWKQKVAFSVSLLHDPQIIFLDEPTAGVSPIVMDELFDRIIEVARSGISILMVEQNARQALNIADKGYVLVQGRNKFTDTGEALLANPEVRKSFLGG